MKNKMKIFLIAVVLCFIGCKGNDKICTCAIFSEGDIGDNTYVIEVYESGMIKTSWGFSPYLVGHLLYREEYIDTERVPLLEDVRETHTAKLNQQEMKDIKGYIERCDLNFPNHWGHDVRLVFISCGNRQRHFFFKTADDEDVNKLIDKLIEFSPLKIKNI
ncbi:MAG: hypothetical protein IJ421_02200 [Prevotella sp.]|nr:hypothetical protein [Prevotella sp.]